MANWLTNIACSGKAVPVELEARLRHCPLGHLGDHSRRTPAAEAQSTAQARRHSLYEDRQIAMQTKGGRQTAPKFQWTWLLFGASIGLVGDADRPVRVP